MKIEVITPLDLEDFVKRIETLEEDNKLHDGLLHDIYENIDQIKKQLGELKEALSDIKKSTDIEEIIKRELNYPEKWDTMAYSTVWEALWEKYNWLKEKLVHLNEIEKQVERLESNSEPFSE